MIVLIESLCGTLAIKRLSVLLLSSFFAPLFFFSYFNIFLKGVGEGAFLRRRQVVCGSLLSLGLLVNVFVVWVPHKIS